LRREKHEEKATSKAMATKERLTRAIQEVEADETF
jgi:hypothetical protein